MMTDTPDAVVRRYLDAARAGDRERVDALRHPFYVASYPQSGERIAGRATVRAVEDADPSPPALVDDQLIACGDFVLVEARLDASGSSSHLVAILEVRDGLIVSERAYRAEPFEAPAWRRELLSRRQSAS